MPHEQSAMLVPLDKNKM